MAQVRWSDAQKSICVEMERKGLEYWQRQRQVFILLYVYLYDVGT